MRYEAGRQASDFDSRSNEDIVEMVEKYDFCRNSERHVLRDIGI